MAFRITPSLGPGLEDIGSPFYWDTNFPDTPSYPLGTRVVGSDGHDYVLVEAGGTIAASTAVTIAAGTTWIATANTGGEFEVPAELTDGVVAGDFFHARRVTEGFEAAI